MFFNVIFALSELTRDGCRQTKVPGTLFFLFLIIPTMALGQTSGTATEQLPKIVLIGDSIRLSYAPTVIDQLAGKAIVVSSKANGGDSDSVLKNFEQWVIRERPAVVYFNCGIHDTKKFRATGKFQVSPRQYEANLRRIVKRIRAETGAVVLFATTTPILDDRAAAARQGRDYELLGTSIEQYNAIAKRVMKELKVPVDDLHVVVAKPDPPFMTKTLIGKDGVHLTTSARELLGKQVAAFVCKHLPR